MFFFSARAKLLVLTDLVHLVNDYSVRCNFVLCGHSESVVNTVMNPILVYSRVEKVG